MENNIVSISRTARHCYQVDCGVILTKEMIVSVLFIFPGEFAIAYMVEVLEPLEVGDSHSSSICIEILKVRDHSVEEE